MATRNGNAGNNTLIGTNNDDDFNGRGGNDTIAGRDGEDFALGGTGNDTISGNDDDDTLFGEAGADNINGGEDDDGINGGSGSDFLQGGPGTDSLTGGPGADTFFINPEDDFDTIIDFTQGSDTISLNGFSQIRNFNDISGSIDIVGNNSEIDLGDIENGTPGEQVLTVLDETGLTAADFAFPAGQIIVANKAIAAIPDNGGAPLPVEPDGGNGGQQQPPPPPDGGDGREGRGDVEMGVLGVMGIRGYAGDDMIG